MRDLQRENESLRSMLTLLLPMVRAPLDSTETLIIKCASRLCDEPKEKCE